MKRLICHSRRALASAAITLVTVVAVAGTAVVSTQPAGAQPTGLDHFLCYPATPVAGVPPFQIPTGVQLTNQFWTTPVVPVIGPPQLHCNPATNVVVNAAGAKTKYPAMSPSWHLLCFGLQNVPTNLNFKVQVTNQFGTAILDTQPAQSLCLPSLKSTLTPPVFNPPGSTEIQPNHFVCYPVTYDPNTTSRFVPPPVVKVKDQFATAKVPVQVGDPQLLCVPTQKTLATGKTYPITNPTAHLLCFAVSPTPVITPVWDKNQFKKGELSIAPTQYLCLPSDKQIVGTLG
jgi:hypothetical protein